jgi:hypothetical protein
MKLKVAASAVLAIVVFWGQAQAHHSFAMFDKEKMISISGTLKEFEWTNPHCWLHVVAADPATGKNVEWAFEMGSITQIQSQGWKVDSVKPGDKITISGHPLKDGSRGGQYRSVKLADGRSFQQVPDQNNNNTVR